MTTASKLSEIWPEWRIEGERIGKGSYGEVYKIVRTDHNVESVAAVKVITIPNNDSDLELQRLEMGFEGTRCFYQSIVDDFVSEIQLMQSMKGTENIVSIEDYKVVERNGEIGWDIYIRMELLTPLVKVQENRKFTEDDVIKLGCDICAALEVCAKRDVMHRDIKPENIFLNDFGNYKLGDFGVARKLERGTAGMSRKGTPYYMAPEVAHARHYDSRVDIYSLGIVLYRLMNHNRIPFLDIHKDQFTATEREDALYRRLNGEQLPPPDEASDELTNVILRACAYNPDDRFQTATEMREALMAVKNHTYVIVPVVVPETEKKKGAEVDRSGETIRQGNKGIKRLRKIFPVVALVGIVLFLSMLFLPHLLSDGDGGGYNYQERSEIEDIIARAEKRADKGDYEDALKKIEEGLKNYPASNSLHDKADEYRDIIKQQVLTKAEEYANTGNYLSAMSVIESARQTYGNNHDYEEAYETYEKAHRTQMKQKALNEAAAHAANGDYASAVAVIQSAMQTYGEDADYTAAYNTYNNELQKQIKQETLAKASQLATQGDYKSAMDTIRNAQSKYGDNAEYRQAYAEYETQYVAQVKAVALSEAQKLAEEDKDYLAAIARLNTAVDELGKDRDVSELTTKIDAYKNAYITKVMADADALVTAKDYDGAIAAVDAGLVDFPGDTQLTAKRTAIEKSRPKHLLDVLKPYEYDHYSTPATSVMAGKTYRKTFEFNAYSRAETYYALYNLDGLYQTMEFDLGHVDGSYMAGIEVNFYLDGEHSAVLSSGPMELPKHHVIDLKGARQLKITVSRTSGYNFENTYYAFANAYLYEK